jgi:hypothetical protein
MTTVKTPPADQPAVQFDPGQAVRLRDTSTELLEDAELHYVPPFADSLDKLDVGKGFLVDMALKAVSLESDCTTTNIAKRLHLGIMVTDALLEQLYRDKLIEKKGVVGLHNHRYAMLDRGWTDVSRLINTCSYTGPAPVSLQAYIDMVGRQARQRRPITRHALEKAMEGLILSDAAKQTLGLVASSGRSLFLSGPSGNGKTAMARALITAIQGDVWIPYAIEIDGQVIRVYDPHSHHPVPVTETDYDQRWLKIRPPLVVVGGEMTLDSMELVATNSQRFYEAPFQLKSNGGLLLVDDLGRQRCSATELLNRWIVPLENRVDYLTLGTGKKVQVPFEQIVIFATNLTTEDLADEAFLRRMGYRLYVMPPGPDTYAAIFNLYAQSKGLSSDPAVIAHIEQRYGRERRLPKSCEPRDLIDRAIEVCKYRREPLRITTETIDMAWDSYFGASVSG